MFNPLNFFSNKNSVDKNLASNKHLIIYSPITGTVLPLTQVNDQTFSQKIVGDGIAISPTSNEVLSPVNGKITKLFKTKHAFCIETNDKIEILVHLGIDTVNLQGKGFEALVKEGDNVSLGDHIINMDISYISKNAKSIVTPVLITNFEKLKKIIICASDGSVTSAGITPLINISY